MSWTRRGVLRRRPSHSLVLISLDNWVKMLWPRFFGKHKIWILKIECDEFTFIGSQWWLSLWSIFSFFIYPKLLKTMRNIRSIYIGRTDSSCDIVSPLLASLLCIIRVIHQVCCRPMIGVLLSPVNVLFRFLAYRTYKWPIQIRVKWSYSECSS